MTPREVAEYLEEAKRAGCQSFGLELPSGLKLSAVFLPDLPLPLDAGHEPAPGGWKGAPDQLDRSLGDE